MNNNEEILNIIFKICDDIEYKINEDKIVTIFEKQDHSIQNFFRRLRFRIPMYRQIVLDEYCSAVFMQIDGQKTIQEIGQNLDRKFGERVYPLYERLLVFLNHIDIDCKYIEKI